MFNKVKKFLKKLIDAIGESNKSNYGSEGINCCDLNKNDKDKK